MWNVEKKEIKYSMVRYRHSHCGFLLSPAFLRGRHTGQSCLVQFFQWEMIRRDDAQWATSDKKKQ